MKYEIMQSVYKDLETLRQNELTEAEKRFNRLNEDLRFKELDAKVRALDFDIAREIAFGRDGSALIAERESAAAERKTVMADLNATEKDLLPRVHCKLCGDSGKAGGKTCKCFNRRYIEKLKQVCDLKYKADFTFANSNLDVVPDSEHRKKLEFLYKTMQLYCKKFPDVKYKNILLMGGVGVGKTCLASAMANALIERGFMVMFITAFEFNRLMLSYHTSPLSSREVYIADVLDCDFLIIDDLGTEQIIKNVTEEYLFQVINARKSNGKHTMFSTNMSLAQLKNFYGERLFSRIVEPNNTIGNLISGDDLRLV